MVGQRNLTGRNKTGQNSHPAKDQSGFGTRENWRPSDSVAPEADLNPDEKPRGKSPAGRRSK